MDLLGDRCLAGFGGRPCALVYDVRLAECQPGLLAAVGQALQPTGQLGLEGGESAKSLGEVARLIEFLDGVGLAKDGVVFALGGGTICDCVSVAAMLFRRGVDLVLLPTTLLAQIDAAVGGKNGLNFAGSKNLAGQFYHPSKIICDTRFLSSLSRRELADGLAEAIKVFAVYDQALFATNIAGKDLGAGLGERDATRLVADALKCKLDLLADDPFEKSSRRLLNYGHAFAHAFEEASGFRLHHGEAVLLGMTVENAISMQLGIAGPGVARLQDEIGRLFTSQCRENWIDATALNALAGEIRLARRGLLNLVCLRDIGEAEILDDVEDSVLLSAWKQAFDLLVDVDGQVA